MTLCQADSGSCAVAVNHFLVGSRASNLAKGQVRGFLTPLRELYPEITFTHRVILEGGDKDRTSPLSRVSTDSGGSAFSSEQEAALARGEVDAVVHSLKDLPTSNPSGSHPFAPARPRGRAGRLVRIDDRGTAKGRTSRDRRAAQNRSAPGRTP
ncbi:hypothetical protein GCM10009654_29120 [Streptomyces hebeiensis]|uniref:hydroxymethylbilane synthase n=1 Tax=Streptomyces hebeiensis TaxID=229486 RepID=A0ABP4FDZ6_9ACTN